MENIKVEEIQQVLNQRHPLRRQRKLRTNENPICHHPVKEMYLDVFHIFLKCNEVSSVVSKAEHFSIWAGASEIFANLISPILNIAQVE